VNSESEDGLEESKRDDSGIGRRPSWPYPTILFLYVVIFFLTPVLGMSTGLILFFGLMGFCVWGAVSRNQYEKLLKSYPDLPRSDYVLNNLIFPVILPLIVLALLMLFRFDGL